MLFANQPSAATAAALRVSRSGTLSRGTANPDRRKPVNRTAIMDRKNKLLDALKMTSKITVEDAMSFLGVSRSTISRLFLEMEQEGLITRVQGGAALARDKWEYTYDRFESVLVEEKRRIGYAAAQMVYDGDTLFLGNGTTLPHMCIALAKRIEEGEVSRLQLFTNSLINLNILSRVTGVFLIGGEYNPLHHDFRGYMAEEAMKPLHFSKSFLGANGVDIERGLTTLDFSSARLMKIAFANSSQRYILADSSKFNVISSIQYADIKGVKGIITDGNNEKYVAALLREGIGVTVV